MLWLVAMGSGCVEKGVSAEGPPDAAIRAVCRPSFRARTGEVLKAGTAFVMVVRSGGSQGSPLLVTAHHLFGPAGGLSEEVPWASLPGVVRSVECPRLQEPGSSIRGVRPLAIPGAGSAFSDDSALDVAAFRVEGEVSDALVPEDVEPRVGETVWLLASVLEGEAATVLRHPAKVVLVESSRLSYEYENSGLNLQATSGAPIVNRLGRVVGVNLGGRRRETKLLGVAQRISTISAGLDRAFAREAGARSD